MSDIKIKLSCDTQPVLAALAKLAATLEAMEARIMSELSDLQAAVANERTVVDSAITLLAGIKAALDTAIANGDPAALQALSADIADQTQRLAQAVQDNTPAAAGEAATSEGTNS